MNSGLPPVNSTPAIPPNRRWIWPFEMMEQIGEGGMGVVYRARYVVNNREVAVKMLPSDVTDKTVLARFERELEVLKSLKHANIVRCFGGVCEDKGRFYAMELVTGGTLESELQRRGRLTWEAVIQYGLQMCAALECAHRQGVVHRDVKPSNFLITSQGDLKLGDFGLAMMSAARKITQAGKTAGTFLYMAPEQIRGQEVTPRTDLYALGCVFFELLTGRPPLMGDTPAATLHMHLKDTPPRASQFALDCPAPLDAIVSRLMEKDAANRYANAEEVARALRSVTSTIVVRTPRKSSPVAPKEAESKRLPAKAGSEPRRAVRLALPEWLPTALGVMLAVSVMINLQNWSRQSKTRTWEATWVTALNSPQQAVRIYAARTLGQSRNLTDVGLRGLVEALDDQSAEVRISAATALGDAGQVARPVLPALLRVRKENSDAIVRQAVNAAIERINEAPGNHGLAGWLLSFVLVVCTAGGLYYWYRSAPASRRTSWTSVST